MNLPTKRYRKTKKNTYKIKQLTAELRKELQEHDDALQAYYETTFDNK